MIENRRSVKIDTIMTKKEIKEIKEAALLMLEHESFENVIDWVLKQIEK